MKPQRKSIQSSLPKDLSEFRKLFDPAQLILRAATEPKAKDALVIYYIPLAASIAARYAYKFPNKDVDILSEAIAAMTETVNNVVKDQNEPDHAVKRIHTRIKFAIQNYISSDCLVVPPVNSEWFRKQNKESNNDLLTAAHASKQLDDSIFEAPSTLDDLWINDILSHRVLDEDEVKVVRWKLEGYTDVEIALIMGRTKSRVGQIKMAAGNKIVKIIKGIY